MSCLLRSLSLKSFPKCLGCKFSSSQVLYGIPDIRLFWSRDSGFLTQFAGKSPNENFKYVPISIHPQVLYDLSFWLPEGISPKEMAAETCDLIRSIGDELVEQVSYISVFLINISES